MSVEILLRKRKVENPKRGREAQIYVRDFANFRE